MRRLLEPHDKGRNHCSTCHGNQDKRDRAELELRARGGMDEDRSWIQFAEIAVDEYAGADEENSNQQLEHGLDHLL